MPATDMSGAAFSDSDSYARSEENFSDEQDNRNFAGEVVGSKEASAQISTSRSVEIGSDFEEDPRLPNQDVEMVDATDHPHGTDGDAPNLDNVAHERDMQQPDESISPDVNRETTDILKLMHGDEEDGLFVLQDAPLPSAVEGDVRHISGGKLDFSEVLDLEEISSLDVSHEIRDKWDEHKHGADPQEPEVAWVKAEEGSGSENSQGVQHTLHHSATGASRHDSFRRILDDAESSASEDGSEFSPEALNDDLSDGEEMEDKHEEREEMTAQPAADGVESQETSTIHDDILADLMDQQNVAMIQRRILERRAKKQGCSGAEEAELQRLKIEVLRLNEQISALEATNAVERQAPQPSRRTEPINEQRKRAAPGDEATNTPKKQKAEKSSGRNQKASSRQRGKGTTKELERLFTNMNPAVAALNVDNLPVYGELQDAGTIREWKAQLRKKMELLPEADRKQYNADQNLLSMARGQFGGKKMCQPSGTGKWCIKGMKSTLLNYQLAGAGWMIKRERSTDDPAGGILADDMGLGKTVESLALILGNPPTKQQRDEGRGATLIVMPPNALFQWQSEIRKHCEDIFFIVFKDRLPINVADIESCSIVLTTYQEVIRSYSCEEHKGETEQRRPRPSPGLLHKIHWYRLMLDEAHAIKNCHSKIVAANMQPAFTACRALQTTHPWALSGTPVQNNLKEIYPYTEFLGLNFANSSKQFNKMIDTVSGRLKMKELLDKVLMMRNKNSLFLGERLVNLPRTHFREPTWTSLSKPEEFIYRCVEEHFRKIYNLASVQNKKNDCIPFLLIYVLRLRQAASHPYLLAPVVETNLPLSDVVMIRKQLAKYETEKTPFLAQIGRVCDRRLRGGTMETIVSTSAHPNDELLECQTFNSAFSLDRQLEMVQKMRSIGIQNCALCKQERPDTVEVECGHYFCPGCIPAMVDIAVLERRETQTCPTCKASLDIPPALYQRRLSALRSRGSVVKNDKGRRGKPLCLPRMRGDDCHGLQPEVKESNSRFLALSDNNETLELTPSAKTIVVMDLILQWKKDHPGDKIIGKVFTEFRITAKILGRMLQDQKVKFLYYFGDFSQEDKQWALNDFSTKEDMGVLITTIRCCGTALNLNCANRAILIDLWWNHHVERQAFSRIWRIGQTKETHFARILIRNSVDGRILELQKKKMAEIDRMLKEFDSKTQGLTFNEVGTLFGRVETDGRGNTRVYADYEDDSDAENDDETVDEQSEESLKNDDEDSDEEVDSDT